MGNQPLRLLHQAMLMTDDEDDDDDDEGEEEGEEEEKTDDPEEDEEDVPDVVESDDEGNQKTSWIHKKKKKGAAEASATKRSKSAPVIPRGVYEAAKIELTGVPNAPGFKAWRQLLNSTVSSASVTPELAFQLIKKVKKGCKFEDFKDGEGFESLASNWQPL